MILAEDGQKMSKSLGNVINPDSIVERFGADTLRVYEMFMGPFEQAIAWSEDALVGPRRFLEKVWRLQEKLSLTKSSDVAVGEHGQTLLDKVSPSAVILMHQTIKKVTEDIENMRFNTAVSTLMIYTNELDKRESVSKDELETLLFLLAPFAPHIAEEMWEGLGHKSSIHTEPWPQYDASKLVSGEATIVVQVNGKVRGKFAAGTDLQEEEAINIAKSLPEIQKWIGDKQVAKHIYVSGKLVNIVTS
jgi:leucyl-tRNA synthetase